MDCCAMYYTFEEYNIIHVLCSRLVVHSRDSDPDATIVAVNFCGYYII